MARDVAYLYAMRHFGCRDYGYNYGNESPRARPPVHALTPIVMPPKGTGTPYQNNGSWWGDFRAYADVGGKREPLRAPGEKHATKDPGLARELYDKRREELKAKRAGGRPDQKTMLPLEYLVDVYIPHLEQQKRNKRGQRGDEPLKRRDAEAIKKAKHAIRTCLTSPAIIGAASLRALGRADMTAMIGELHRLKTTSGRLVSPQTVRRHCMELSAMFEQARFEEFMDANPLDKHPRIPPQKRGSALDPDGFLTRDEVRRLLAEVVPSSKSPWAVEQAYVLFYSGCRLDELNGILVRDVDLDEQLLHVLDHEHRSVKSRYSRRPVPLWPKLAAVLRASLERKPRPANGILFPRAGSNMDQTLEKQMMTRIRKSLQSAAERAGIEKKIGHHIARHSYVSARREMVELTPLGKEVPISNAVIVREVGHADDDLIQNTYGHLPRSRTPQLILDYGDEAVDFGEREKRGKELMSRAVKEGLRRRKERLEAESDRIRIVLEGDPASSAGRRSRKTKAALR